MVEAVFPTVTLPFPNGEPEVVLAFPNEKEEELPLPNSVPEVLLLPEENAKGVLPNPELGVLLPNPGDLLPNAETAAPLVAEAGLEGEEKGEVKGEASTWPNADLGPYENWVTRSVIPSCFLFFSRDEEDESSGPGLPKIGDPQTLYKRESERERERGQRRRMRQSQCLVLVME